LLVHHINRLLNLPSIHHNNLHQNLHFNLLFFLVCNQAVNQVPNHCTIPPINHQLNLLFSR
jgi:hypothetical protein